VYANIRQSLVSTLNLAHLIPLSAVWAGPERSVHLDGPPWIVTRTDGATPFRLGTHVGDVGHTLIVGPTGAGKSVLLATMILQFRRYPGSRVFVFDKGRSARASILGLAGACPGLFRLRRLRIPRSNGHPTAAFRFGNVVGIRNKIRFRSSILTACFLAVYASAPASRPAAWQHLLPACPLRL
jgi:hypothetical protein